MFAATDLGFLDVRLGTAVGKGGMHGDKVNPRGPGMPVEHCRILEVLAKNKVGRKEVFV